MIGRQGNPPNRAGFPNRYSEWITAGAGGTARYGADNPRGT